ncbi:SGNH/GDSL hydrolase family protein [Aliikangiella sp. IMCC44359]|uniref:SGNH/GDSL hydrolase family protein n=1 Tax=Aliikangiella sp. IMCC44359 TaxID=3459125 RepID=UPI00403A97B1
MTKILCFGDSITLGEKDDKHGGWANRLATLLISQYLDANLQAITLYNLGIAGETTDGLAQRFKTEVSARRFKNDKTLVVFFYGANDIVIRKEKNTVPVEYFKRNLTKCIEYAVSLNIEVLLLSPLPVSDKIDGKLNRYNQLLYNRDLVEYQQLIRQTSIEFNCQYLDTYSLFMQNDKELLLSSDGIHPNSNGHQLLYNEVAKKLNLMTVIHQDFCKKSAT